MFEGLMGRVAGRFKQVEPRRRAGRLVLGLLSDLPRKNCWTIAEWAREAGPHGMQHLLCRAVWDADAYGCCGPHRAAIADQITRPPALLQRHRPHVRLACRPPGYCAARRSGWSAHT
ncbi:hypothetical protein ACVW19_002700 [Streptomyces sp. TE5632]